MSIRTERVGRMIQREVADLLTTDFGEASQSLITVTGVRMTDDLGMAYVDVSVLGADDLQRKTALARLDAQSTEIRHALSQRIRHQLKRMPEIKFFLDEGAQRRERMDDIFAQIAADRGNDRDARGGRRGAVARRLLGVSADLRIVTSSEPITRPVASGAFLVDKPGGITSFGVVKKVRWALGVKKVGHAGTLDPMATGLLIVLVGREATRQQDRFMGLPKVYTGTVRLGQTTTSYDAETTIETDVDASGVTDDAVEAALRRLPGRDPAAAPDLLGHQEGRGAAVQEGPARRDRRDRAPPDDRLRVRRAPTGAATTSTSASSARRGPTSGRSPTTWGRRSGVGGHLVALRREAIGPFQAAEAFGLDALVEAARQPA